MKDLNDPFNDQLKMSDLFPLSKEKIVILIYDFLKHLWLSNQNNKHKNDMLITNKTALHMNRIKMLALKMGYKLKQVMLQNQPIVLPTHHHHPSLVKKFQSHTRVHLLEQQTVFYPSHLSDFKEQLHTVFTGKRKANFVYGHIIHIHIYFANPLIHG